LKGQIGESSQDFSWHVPRLPREDWPRADTHNHCRPDSRGKNTVAELVAERCVETGRTVVVADVDDVAFMLRPPARRAELWATADRAHGALVGQWVQSKVDVVVPLGPIYDKAEQEALSAGSLRR
jgi:hypothetical protein